MDVQFTAIAINLAIFVGGLALIIYMPQPFKFFGTLGVVYTGAGFLIEFLTYLVPSISLGISRNLAGAFFVFAMVFMQIMNIFLKGK